MAAFLRFTIVPFGADVLPFVTFFPATLFAAFIGGWRPGLFAAVLGGLIGWWSFVQPLYGFFPLTPGAVVGLLAYTLTSLLVVLGANHHRSLIEKLKAEEAFRQMVGDELAHRLKNKVATIQSIVGYQLRDNPPLRDAISRRLSALSGTDDLIMATQGKGAALDAIVSTEVGPYDAARALIQGPKITLEPRLALSMALIVHELATNAAKHGALSSPSGRVLIRWQLSPGPADAAGGTILTMEWQENGGPPVSPPAVRGFGLRLLAIALDQFNGKVEPAFEPDGLVCRMTVPLSATTGLAGDEPEALPRSGQSEASPTPGHPIDIARSPG
jgi:two-component sensor histidine kinase